MLPVLQTNHLGKSFHLERQPQATRFTDELLRWIGQKKPATREAPFWALRDVSFSVQPGEVVGILGRNGSGKSTLLKLLTQILHPTTGRIEIVGRVGCLLEVGTGFHPELTGRENIYLNGAILGMSRSEVARKFDEIVAFSEVEPFLDEPVKHYSSGMTLRLAFAVAAHLEPEILIIDEVLAVGDVPFQKKCLGRLRTLTEASGRTVLLVSHNPAAMASLCTRGLVLDHGRLVFDGDIHEALQSAGSATDQRSAKWTGPAGDSTAQLVNAEIAPRDVLRGWDTGNAFTISATVNLLETIEGLVFGLRIYSEYGTELVCTLFDDAETDLAPRFDPCRLMQTWVIPPNTLAPGRYRIAFEVSIARRKVCHQTDVGELEFSLENVTGIGRRYPMQGVRGFTSLLRPNWAAEREIRPLPNVSVNPR